jgi:hypothetical protein
MHGRAYHRINAANRFIADAKQAMYFLLIAPDGITAMTTPSDKPRLSKTSLQALEEAEQRRQKRSKTEPPKEYGGPKGVEPTRYGDWERKGIASDF